MSWQEEHYEASRKEQSERDKLNQESKRRQSLTRERGELRRNKRGLKKQRQEELSEATSTKERREIKEKFESQLNDIDTSIESNKKARDNEPQDDKADDIVEGDTSNDLILAFNEETITICVNGSTVNRIFLTQET
jgi:hypothetical protein